MGGGRKGRLERGKGRRHEGRLNDGIDAFVEQQTLQSSEASQLAIRSVCVVVKNGIITGSSSEASQLVTRSMRVSNDVVMMDVFTTRWAEVAMRYNQRTDGEGEGSKRKKRRKEHGEAGLQSKKDERKGEITVKKKISVLATHYRFLMLHKGMGR